MTWLLAWLYLYTQTARSTDSSFVHLTGKRNLQIFSSNQKIGTHFLGRTGHTSPLLTGAHRPRPARFAASTPWAGTLHQHAVCSWWFPEHHHATRPTNVCDPLLSPVYLAEETELQHRRVAPPRKSHLCPYPFTPYLQHGSLHSYRLSLPLPWCPWC